jgi:diaminopimelate decarboxylase
MAWWENEFVRIRGGRLALGRYAAATLAAKFGTPLYAYGRARIRNRCRDLARSAGKAIAGEVRLCYAMKANAHPGILGALRSEGAWIDAVSPGEVWAALAAGYPARRILFTGTSLGPEDYRAAFAVDGLTVAVDAVEQIEDMAHVRRRWFRGKAIRVAVRWNPGIGGGFHPKVVTAGERSSDGTPIKFGIEEKRVLDAFREAAAAGFHPVGLHQHLGSGWVAQDFPSVAEAVARMADKASDIEAAGFPLEFLDFGGGFGPRYGRSQSIFPLERYLALIGRTLKRAGLGGKAVAFEPGKYLVADAGVLLLRVAYIKESYGNVFACVSGGTLNTLPRPAIYAQVHHEIVNGRDPAGRADTRVTIAGHLCETGDVFGRDVPMPRPRRGDILAVLCAGAYGRSMASNYNLRPIPDEILI